MSTSPTIAYTQRAVNTVEQYCTFQKDDNIIFKGAKVISRGLSDTVLVLAGLIESAVFAALTIIAFPTKVKMLSSTDRSAQAFNNAKRAASAAANAFKGIAGYSSKSAVQKLEIPAPVIVEKVVQPVIQVKQAEQPIIQPVVKKSENAFLKFLQDNKKTIFLTGGGLAALATWYLYPTTQNPITKTVTDLTKMCPNGHFEIFEQSPNPNFINLATETSSENSSFSLQGSVVSIIAFLVPTMFAFARNGR